MSINYLIYENDMAITGAKIAVRNKLYVSGWDLSYFLREFINKEISGFIILAIEDGYPVGVLAAEEDGFIMLFVRKAKRKQGIGTELFKRASEILNEKIKHDFGTDGSHIFFTKTKEKVFGKNWQEILSDD